MIYNITNLSKSNLIITIILFLSKGTKISSSFPWRAFHRPTWNPICLSIIYSRSFENIFETQINLQWLSYVGRGVTNESFHLEGKYEF